MARWPPPVYHIEVELDVPRAFAFRWCTDYRSDDARRGGERYERRVIERKDRWVRMEDLWWQPDGWGWRRSDVTLSPPGRWHADSVGTIRDASIDYELRELPDGRCRLSLTMRRRPSAIRPTQPSKRQFEAHLRQLWGHFARSMRKEYRASRRARSGRVSRRRSRP